MQLMTSLLILAAATSAAQAKPPRPSRAYTLSIDTGTVDHREVDDELEVPRWIDALIAASEHGRWTTSDGRIQDLQPGREPQRSLPTAQDLFRIAVGTDLGLRVIHLLSDNREDLKLSSDTLLIPRVGLDINTRHIRFRPDLGAKHLRFLPGAEVGFDRNGTAGFAVTAALAYEP